MPDPSPAQPEQRAAAEPPARYQASLATVLREWGRIGCIGFGGPPGWVVGPGDTTDAVLPAGSSSWGPATTLSVEGNDGPAHSLSMAVNASGGAIIMFNGGLNNLWALSGTVTGGFSAPVLVASGSGSTSYHQLGTSAVALNNAGQASAAWSVLDGQTGLLTRSASGAWTDKVVVTRSAPALAVSTAIDGAGNAIAIFGSSYAWHWPAAAGRRPRRCRPDPPAGWPSPTRPAPSSTPTPPATHSPSPPEPPASAPAADHTPAWAT